jgi:hypothetical protein
MCTYNDVFDYYLFYSGRLPRTGAEAKKVKSDQMISN